MNSPLSINEQYAAIRAANKGVLPSVAELRSTTTLKDPAPWLLELLGGGTSAAGPTVNEDTALTLAALYGCVRVLSTAIATLPVGLYRRVDGATRQAFDTKEHYIFAENPSDLYTSFTFRSTMEFHRLIRGNAYARIYRDGRGQPQRLEILHPSRVRPFLKEDRLYYHVNFDAGAQTLMDYEVIHVKNMSSDGILGRSPIQVHRDTIGIGLSNRNFVSDIHKNGGRLRGAITHPGKLNEEQVDLLRFSFIEAVNSGRFPLLQNGADFKAISLTPADAEYIRTHNLTALDICAIYGVPPHKIGILDRATFSNIEHQAIEYTQETLLPAVKNWEPELNRKILVGEMRKTHFYRFNLEGRMRGDMRSRMMAYAIARQWGWLNADEIRELENMNPLPDGQGQIYLSPLNMVPADEYTKANDDEDDEDEPNAAPTKG